MSATSILINVGAKTAQAVSELNKVNGALGQQMSAADKAASAFRKMNGPALAALGGIAAGAGYAVNAASDLGESVNAVNKVFGRSAGTIRAFGETAAEAVGLSNQQFNELATSTGSLLTNMGQGTKQAADNTLLLAQRAADMASVFNTDVSQAMEAVNAGLRGESEPLRAFGMQISDAALKAKALELGLYDGTGALDANAKAAATQALIMEQTNSIAGDFADTQDGMANSTRTLTAQISDLAADLGTALLPYIEDGIALLRRFADWISRNTTLVKVIVTVVASLAAVIVTVNAAMKAWAAIQTVLNVVMSANPIGLIILAIAALVAGIIYAYRNSETFRTAIQKVWEWLKKLWQSGIDPVTAAWDEFTVAIRAAWDWVGRLISKVGHLLAKLNPLKALGGLIDKVTGRAAPSALSAATAGRAATLGTRSITPTIRSTPATVTINVLGSGDPIRTGATIKRILETNDVAQGRPRGRPLAMAW